MFVVCKELCWITVAWWFESKSSWCAMKRADQSAFLAEHTSAKSPITEDVAEDNVRKWEIAQAILRGLDLAFPTRDSFLTNTVRIIENTGAKTNSIPKFITRVTNFGDGAFLVPYLK